MSYHIRYKCQWHDQASSTSSTKKNGGTINVISAPIKVWSGIISRIFNPEPYPDGRKSTFKRDNIMWDLGLCTLFGNFFGNNRCACNRRGIMGLNLPNQGSKFERPRADKPGWSEHREQWNSMNALDNVGGSQVSHNFNICILHVLLIVFLYEKVAERKE